MQKSLSILIVLSIILMGILTQGYAATNTVNVDELKQIEKNDQFDIQIIEKTVERNTGIRTGDNDYLILTIRNSSDKDLSGLSIYLVAYDNDNRQVEIGSGIISFSTTQTPQVFSASSLLIKSKQEKDLTIRCNADKFSGVRAIVSAYTTSDNVVIENINAEKWYDAVYTDKKVETIYFDDNMDYGEIESKPGETVDIAAIKNLNVINSFPVQIIEKKIKVGGGSSFFGESDLLVLKIENRSSKTIVNPVVYVISFDNRLNPKSLGIIKTSFPYIQILSVNSEKTIKIEPDTYETFQMDCDAKDIAGMFAMIASYELEDGTVCENPLANLWLESVITSNQYELD